jgi:hypothetical protein
VIGCNSLKCMFPFNFVLESSCCRSLLWQNRFLFHELGIGGCLLGLFNSLLGRCKGLIGKLVLRVDLLGLVNRLLHQFTQDA